ncbi:MAG: hypothetical protein ABL930_12175 [Pseudobdellovibrio sp.]
MTYRQKAAHSDFIGDSNLGIEILEVNGRKLFSKIKFPPEGNQYSESQIKIFEDLFLNEAAYAKKLSDLGLGPKFEGVVKGPDGKYRIVTEFVEGFEIHLDDIPKNFEKLTVQNIKDMQAAAKKLADVGIETVDLQFRIGKNGKVYVIDPEYFENLANSTPAQREITKQLIERDFANLISAHSRLGH